MLPFCHLGTTPRSSTTQPLRCRCAERTVLELCGLAGRSTSVREQRFSYPASSMLALVFAASLFAAAGTNAAVPESSGYATMPDGARLFWRALGSGSPTVIMIHGGPGSTMNESLPDLANLASGRRLLFYDQRGGGRSGPIPDLSAVTAEQ